MCGIYCVCVCSLEYVRDEVLLPAVVCELMRVLSLGEDCVLWCDGRVYIKVCVVAIGDVS